MAGNANAACPVPVPRAHGSRHGTAGAGSVGKKPGTPNFVSVCPAGGRAVPQLNNALGHHRFRHFHEAGNVCPLHIVYVAVRLSAVLDALGMHCRHD